MVFVVDPVALPLPRQNLHSATVHYVLKFWHLTITRLTHARSGDETCMSCLLYQRVQWFPHHSSVHSFVDCGALQTVVLLCESYYFSFHFFLTICVRKNKL